MIVTNLPVVEPELNKNEKIIFEYLLNELEISNSRSIKLSLNSFKNDLDMIQNLFEKIFELSTKKIVVKDEETRMRTLCFNIIDSYSIIDNNLLIVFSEPIYELFSKKETSFHIYSLLFQNKYTLRLFKVFNKSLSTLTFSLDELKKNINLDDSYDRLYDFEKKILKNSIEEINSYTNLDVKYQKKYSKVKNEPMKLILTITKKSERRSEYRDNFKKSYNDLIEKFKTIYDF